MGLEKDLLPGKALVVCLRPFIEHLALANLSPKTIRQHVDNLWTLGGEIIRDLHYDPSRRKMAADRLLRDAVHEYGGPVVQQRFGGTATLFRLDLPQALPVPHSTPLVTLPVTHKFPGRSQQ